MLYEIRLTLRYDYAAQAERGRHVICLRPADLPGVQRMIAGQVGIEPRPGEWTTSRDFFGNVSDAVAISQPHGEMVVTLKARVERLPPVLAADLSPALGDLAAEIADVTALDALSPVHFLAPSPRVPDVPAITAHARRSVAGAGSVLSAVLTLGQALHDQMTFDPDATTVDTTPAEAFALRRGVCQDFTHVMIAGLRGLGIPAGYVSGFLRTIPPKGTARLEGADAMHAWVRAWCGPVTGWTEYDPTNAMAAGEDHVVVAYGRDYGDVAPVRGSARSSGGHSIDQAVDVIVAG